MELGFLPMKVLYGSAEVHTFKRRARCISSMKRFMEEIARLKKAEGSRRDIYRATLRTNT